MGAELLSILDETENGFVWEHIQSYAEQAHGAWLGINVKGPAFNRFRLVTLYFLLTFSANFQANYLALLVDSLVGFS